VQYDVTPMSRQLLTGIGGRTSSAEVARLRRRRRLSVRWMNGGSGSLDLTVCKFEIGRQRVWSRRRATSLKRDAPERAGRWGCSAGARSRAAFRPETGREGDGESTRCKRDEKGVRTSLRLSTMTVSKGSLVSADLGVDQTASTLGMTIGLRCSCSITCGMLVVSPSVSTNRTERPAKLRGSTEPVNL
jgi:hypothetical protein